MTRTVGFIMLGLAAALLFVARPRNGIVVGWLRQDIRQQIIGIALIILIAIGGFLALQG